MTVEIQQEMRKPQSIKDSLQVKWNIKGDNLI